MAARHAAWGRHTTMINFGSRDDIGGGGACVVAGQCPLSVEAMTMGDRVAVLKDGLLMQCDPPRALYDRPANLFVAGFIGSPAMNILTVEKADGGVRVGDDVVPVQRALLDAVPGLHVAIGIRPEVLGLVGTGRGFAVRVNLVEELGADAFLYGTLTPSADAGGLVGDEITARVDPRAVPDADSTVYFQASSGQVHVFDPATGNRVG